MKAANHGKDLQEELWAVVTFDLAALREHHVDQAGLQVVLHVHSVRLVVVLSVFGLIKGKYVETKVNCDERLSTAFEVVDEKILGLFLLVKINV